MRFYEKKCEQMVSLIRSGSWELHYKNEIFKFTIQWNFPA